MFLAYSFVGKLPHYIIYTIFQARIFFSGDIYLIISDISSEYLKDIEKYDIKIIDYKDVMSQEFNDVLSYSFKKFQIVYGLNGREELFIRSFERFFILQNLMKNNNLEDCLFLELDNLIYDNPNKWLNEFSKNELCYMFDNFDRCSAGIIYVKNYKSLNGFLDYSLDFIKNTKDFLNEMTTLYRYYIINTNSIQILPTYFSNNIYPNIVNDNIDKYNSIFDAADLGIYLLGLDPYHTKGVVITGLKGVGGLIDYTKHTIEWKNDEDGLRKPYILDNNNNWLKINNLHVHSKMLENGLSRPY